MCLILKMEKQNFLKFKSLPVTLFTKEFLHLLL